MTDYRRNRVPGGTYFFTVNLADRRTDLLVRHIDDLRYAVKRARA
jgi:putative transposase